MTGICLTDVKDFWKKSCLSTPSHLAVTAPVGHAAPLRYAGTCAALFPPGNLAVAPVRP